VHFRFVDLTESRNRMRDWNRGCIVRGHGYLLPMGRHFHRAREWIKGATKRLDGMNCSRMDRP
jgi:hypothetical protein